MEQKFNVGDVVCLNSEPDRKLTVINFFDDDMVTVTHFNETTQEYQSMGVPKACLKLKEK